MTIVEEIEEVAEGMAESPVKRKTNRFSEGQCNWLGTPLQEETARLIKCAIAGCVGAKYTLTEEPHNFREVMIGGKVVTTKGDGWYI
jgi:hypothetical protein